MRGMRVTGRAMKTGGTRASQGVTRPSVNQGAARTSANQASRGGHRPTGQTGLGGAALRTGAPCITIHTHKVVEPRVRKDPKVPAYRIAAASIYEIEESAKWNPHRSGVAPCTVKRLIGPAPRNQKRIQIWNPCENPGTLDVVNISLVWCAVADKSKVKLGDAPFAVVAQLALERSENEPKSKDIPENYTVYVAYAPVTHIFSEEDPSESERS